MVALPSHSPYPGEPCLIEGIAGLPFGRSQGDTRTMNRKPTGATKRLKRLPTPPDTNSTARTESGARSRRANATGTDAVAKTTPRLGAHRAPGSLDTTGNHDAHVDKPARRRPSGRATIADVARHAQVSPMTVSRALKNPAQVLPEARSRVEAAVAALGYVPSHAARTLASSRSRVVGVLVPSLSNAVFVDTLAGIQDCLGPAGYQFLIGNTNYSAEKQTELVSTYLTHAPDGFLVTGIDGSGAIRQRLAAARVPVVHMYDLSRAADEWSVGFSQQSAGFTLTRYLLDRGYRRPGFIAAQLDPRTMQRRAGFRRALREAGLDPDVEILTNEPSSVGLGSALLARMLEHAPHVMRSFAATTIWRSARYSNVSVGDLPCLAKSRLPGSTICLLPHGPRHRSPRSRRRDIRSDSKLPDCCCRF